MNIDWNAYGNTLRRRMMWVGWALGLNPMPPFPWWNRIACLAKGHIIRVFPGSATTDKPITYCIRCGKTYE